MSKNVQKRYSEAFKLRVVKAYENGASINSLRQEYGVGSHLTIKRWIKKYGRSGLRSGVVRIQTVQDHQEFQDMKERIQELEKALAQAVLDKQMLETTLEVASQALEMDLKKISARNHNSGQAALRCAHRASLQLVWSPPAELLPGAQAASGASCSRPVDLGVG